MPRKKVLKFREKFLLPNSVDLIRALKDHREPALSPSWIAKIEKWDFTPCWKHTDRQTLAVFANWLLKSPIFKEDKRGIHLRCPRSRTIPASEVDSAKALLLLLGLSGELANFFLSMQTKRGIYSHFLEKPLSIVKGLKDYKRPLTKLGIVKEDTFDSVYLKIGGWMQRFVIRSLERIPSSKKEELVVGLYPYFRNLTGLRDISIYGFIGHIIKHLGTEKGDARNISERIRKRLERKGIKKGLKEKNLDIQRLRKTLRYLTHLPL